MPERDDATVKDEKVEEHGITAWASTVEKLNEVGGKTELKLVSEGETLSYVPYIPLDECSSQYSLEMLLRTVDNG